ncbi:ribonuclease H2 subunit B [Biomphalaria glabrata]|uniref:Ribonuclease H2 subunit B n=1 Tax=Biomphalaria glabrata TaxID=6526 RepID=A0A9U8DZV2_BIOGL|nr:ribonuclease H2 subunit B-like [Biomphalaria glabrata]KAI8751175.1 ribonuclease H2 subunit B-like [Biomphalaria glabrata]
MSSSTRKSSRKSQEEKPRPEKRDIKNSDRWIFLMKNEIITCNEEGLKPTLCKLRHPRLKTGVMYLLSADCTSVYELTAFKEKFRSWFIGNSVLSNGQMYITTPLDPLFLILPYIINSGETNRFMTLEQIVLDEEFPDSHKLVTCCNPEQLQLVSDCKEIDDDLKVFKFNKEKTLSWLKKKTEAVAEALEMKKIPVSSGSSHSSIFIPSGNAEICKDSYMIFAHGILSEYLSLDLEAELKTFIGLNTTNETPSPTSVTDEPPNKKQKLTTVVAPLEDYTQGKDLKKDKSKTSKVSAAQKRLDKVDKTGMKSMLSFFSPKSTK